MKWQSYICTHAMITSFAPVQMNHWACAHAKCLHMERIISKVSDQ